MPSKTSPWTDCFLSPESSHSVLSQCPLSPSYHLIFIGGSCNCKHSNCSLNICPFPTTTYFKRMRFSQLSNVFVCLPWAVPLCSALRRGSFPHLCISTLPLLTHAIHLCTDQSECLSMSGQPIRRCPHFKHLLSFCWRWGWAGSPSHKRKHRSFKASAQERESVGGEDSIP